MNARSCRFTHFTAVEGRSSLQEKKKQTFAGYHRALQEKRGQLQIGVGPLRPIPWIMRPVLNGYAVTCKALNDLHH